MSTWLVVIVAGLGSYLFRASMVMLIGRGGVPTALERVSVLVAPAVFAAMAAGGVVAACVEADAAGVAGVLPPLVAVAAAVAAVRRTGSPQAAIAAGMPTLWILSAVAPS